MATLREKHENLESETAEMFYELLKNWQNDLVFLEIDEEAGYDEEQEEKLSDCEIVEIYNEYSGNVFSIYVIGISKNGTIQGALVNDDMVVDDYRFSDLASLLYKINIVEILEANK